MSDAPDKIWVEKQIAEPGNHGSTAWPNTDCESDIEYTRSDLIPTPAQIAADERVRGLIEAAQAQLDYMDACNDNGDLERNLRAALAALGEDG